MSSFDSISGTAVSANDEYCDRSIFLTAFRIGFKTIGSLDPGIDDYNAVKSVDSKSSYSTMSELYSFLHLLASFPLNLLTAYAMNANTKSVAGDAFLRNFVIRAIEDYQKDCQDKSKGNMLSIFNE